MNNKNIVCIGGGHGLGQLLKALSSIEKVNLTGIVTTTDNGGSTGRLRESSESIAWGDIRYCLTQLSHSNSIQSLLFEHRFEQLGELSGHSLGNLMFCAINHLCLKPTDSVKVMTNFLKIEATILPMSDQPTHLISEIDHKQTFVGEVLVDKHIQQNITDLRLDPLVKPTTEVVDSLRKGQLLFLSPGSFFTSTLPSLLMTEVVNTINSNANLQIFLLLNVKKEFNNGCDDVAYQLNFIRKIGLTKKLTVIIPSHRRDEINIGNEQGLIIDLPADDHGRHSLSALKACLHSIVH